MHRRFTAVKVTALAIGAVVALSGCSRHSDDASSSTPSEASSTATTQAVSTTTAAVAPTLDAKHKAQVEKVQSEVAQSLVDNPPSITAVAGSPADSATSDQITSLEKSLVSGSTGKQIADNFAAALCDKDANNPAIRSALESWGKIAAVGMAEQSARPTPKVSRVRVDGDSASALVSLHVGGKDVAIEHRYVKQDGAWKLCMS